jgi:hypothetical protein
VPVLVLACALPALAAGCGGSGGTTKAGYVAKVNALCATEKQEIRQLSFSHASLISLVSRDNRVRENVAAQIEAIKPPSSEAISPEWLALRRAAISAANKVAAAGLPSSIARAQGLVFNEESEKARRLAIPYGLTECHGFASV